MNTLIFILLVVAVLAALAVVRRWRRLETRRSAATIRRLETICRLHPDELAARLGVGEERP